MKKFGWIAFIGAVVIGVAAANLVPFGKVSVKDVVHSFDNSVKGSGNVVTESRAVADFSAVDVGGVFRVEITAGKDFSVNVDADENLLPHIKTDVSGDMLEISTDAKISSSNPILVRITAPEITELRASGASSVSLLDIKNNSIDVDLSGVSELTATGETEKLRAELSGASVLKARSLKSETADVDASGASRAYVFASQSLSADASGASTVVYEGNPTNVEKDVSRASSVRAD